MILESKKIKSVTVSIVSSSVCYEVMGPDAMNLVFWMLSFSCTFLLLKQGLALNWQRRIKEFVGFKKNFMLISSHFWLKVGISFNCEFKLQNIVILATLMILSFIQITNVLISSQCDCCRYYPLSQVLWNYGSYWMSLDLLISCFNKKGYVTHLAFKYFKLYFDIQFPF